MTQGGQYPFAGCFQPGTNMVVAQFTSGANGAVPTSTTKKAGFGTVVRDSAGTYHVPFSNPWAACFGGYGNVFPVGGAYDAAIANDVKIFGYTASTKTISFATTAPDDGLVTDMASGDILTLVLFMGQERIPGRR